MVDFDKKISEEQADRKERILPLTEQNISTGTSLMM